MTTPELELAGRVEVSFGTARGNLRSTRWRQVAEVVWVLLLAGGLAWSVQRFIVKPYRIPSASMRTTLEEGDRILAARFPLFYTDPHRGQVVVFHPPGLGDTAIRSAKTKASVTYVKRVIGVGGETIEGKGGKVIVCSAAKKCSTLVEPYVRGRTLDFSQVTIPKGYFFMMGDNRLDSEDSRVWGLLPRTNVVGIAFATYWPVNRLGGL